MPQFQLHIEGLLLSVSISQLVYTITHIENEVTIRHLTELELSTSLVLINICFQNWFVRYC